MFLASVFAFYKAIYNADAISKHDGRFLFALVH